MGLRCGEINGLKYSDVDYICCSTYGNPRSKGYHHPYFKKLLASLELPDIYGDTAEIIEDCLYAIEPFMKEVMPEQRENKYYDYSDIEEIESIADEYLQAA